MKIFFPAESNVKERRVSVVPNTIKKLGKLGAELCVESGVGKSVHFTDEQYASAGAEIVKNRKEALSIADLVLRLGKPPLDEISLLKSGGIHISYLDPFREPTLLLALAKANTSAICMEMIPRSTVAQKMDALSSQANLAGYVAVTLATDSMQQIFPMMITPSGTVSPAKVFIIGVGVAGLQAIATARRLGAVVEAFDTRPVVEEQVKSLGAQFVKVDLGETGQTAQGYARELTPEQLAKQREVMAEHCAQADVVITTAQVFGRQAPRIITSAMLERMKPGSVVVDLAVETGGNVEGSRLDEVVDFNGVKLIGHGNLAGRVPRTASEMYSNNLGNLIEHFWNSKEKTFRLDPAHDILKECLVTHNGVICNERLRQLVEPKKESAAS